MAVFTAIPDTDLDANSPITENLMLALRDNPLAIAQGDATAPRVAKEALGPNTVGDYLLTSSQTTVGTITASHTGSIATVYATIPEGWYMYNLGAAFQDGVAQTVGIQIYANSVWKTIYSVNTGSDAEVKNGSAIISNGANVRIFVTTTVTNKLVSCYFRYNKLN